MMGIDRLIRVTGIAVVFGSWLSGVGAQTPPAVGPASPQGASPVVAGQAPGTAPGRGQARGPIAPVVIGPPAPVPAEVAIPRPTPTELAQVNEAVQRFIDTDKSAASPLLKRFQSLLLLHLQVS